MINVKEEKLKILKNIENVKSVFDIACGFGFFSEYFLDLGCDVTAIDLHVPRIKKCDRFKFLKNDIRDYEFKEEFDLNICSLFLHFFDVESAKKLISNMQKTTNCGGYNLIICMSNEDGLSKENSTKFYPKKSDLINLYPDWELVNILQDETETENHNNLGEHSHNVIFVLFKKLCF